MDKIFIKLSILILEKLETVQLMELTVSQYKFSQLNFSPIFSSFMSQSGCINLDIAILGDFF